ncbi:hypothetical protein EV360DRAFT_90154 [Lentinula raphanica]|nr:hypothetical protein EV360DRAFT_90154 [Lentinula raphanica]
MAEFGIIHRNEASGALAGLTRVRRFMQVTHTYFIEEEINPLSDFMKHIYRVLGFAFHHSPLDLKTPCVPLKLEILLKRHCSVPLPRTCRILQPGPRIQQLTKGLDKQHPGKWELNPGHGAFYGPKIDITIRDVLRRSFQCATIQVDFQLPERFNLKYRTAEDPGSETSTSRPYVYLGQS